MHCADMYCLRSMLVGIFLTTCRLHTVSCVDFKDNGYSLVVAIHKNVPENPDIITQLKAMIESGSESMYTSTRKLFYIREVTILVPNTWKRDAAWGQSNDISFQEADIRVDVPHPGRDDTPYTFQPGQCGESGRYIHFTPNFLTQVAINRDNFGDSGRVLVHEFAQLRFGVFDEYGYPGNQQHPVYYIEPGSNTLRATACSREITGNFVDIKNDQSCTTGDINKPIRDDCDYKPDRNSPSTSSIMYATFLDKVTQFCESLTEDAQMRHNIDAPNMHNKMCGGLGTWDIIQKHEDSKSSSPDIVEDRKPTINVVHHGGSDKTDCGRRLVLVFDVSGSMGGRPFFRLKQFADNLIRDILPLGTELGIVTFASTATIRSYMTKITSDAVRETIITRLPTSTGGGTNIGSGLISAINLLSPVGTDGDDRGRIFLITDGKDSREFSLKILEANVVIHALAYSDAASAKLRPLTANTGGQYSYFDDTSSSTALDGAAERLLKDISVCPDDNTLVVYRKPITVSQAHDGTVTIDSTVGNNTLFVFSLESGSTIQVTLEDPSGKVIDTGSQYYSKDTSLDIIRYRIPDTKSGVWKYRLRSTSTESAIVVVKSHPREGVLPFETESWISTTSFNFENTEPVTAYTYVHQGYAPVLNAVVQIDITTSSGTSITKFLKDDGILPDNTANDGVYSTYLVEFNSNSRFSMETRVEADDDTVILRKGNLLNGRVLSANRDPSTTLETEKVEPFTRTESVGAIDITGFDPSRDQIDPGRVIDLDLGIHDKSKRHLKLTWTAPGDDLNVGNVTRYEIRLSTSFEHLRSNFSTSTLITSTLLVDGSLEPLDAGSQQMIIFKLPGNWSDDFIVVGLIAYDDGDRNSPLSNLKATTFEDIIVPETYKPSDAPADLSILWIALIFGVLAVSAVVIVVSVVCVCKRKTGKKSIA